MHLIVLLAHRGVYRAFAYFISRASFIILHIDVTFQVSYLLGARDFKVFGRFYAYNSVWILANPNLYWSGIVILGAGAGNRDLLLSHIPHIHFSESMLSGWLYCCTNLAYNHGWDSPYRPRSTALCLFLNYWKQRYLESLSHELWPIRIVGKSSLRIWIQIISSAPSDTHSTATGTK